MNLNVWVTENKRFKYKEFFFSKTDPDFYKRSDVDIADALRGVINLGVEAVLDPIAIAMQNEFRIKVPIHITSGFRTPELNKKVGGVPDSDHKYGCAVDIIPGNNNLNSIDFKDTILELLPVLPFRQMIAYRKKPHVHISWNIPGRQYAREVLTV